MVKKGDRIKIISLAEADKEPSISEGDKGEVTDVIDSEVIGKQVFVDFDNGASLTVLPEDEYKIIDE